MARGKAGDGKAFESEIATACQAAGMWSRNSNSTLPTCDHFGCFPLCVGHPMGMGQLVIGVSVLLECKETRDGRISFSRIEPKEREAFEGHLERSGLGWVLIKDVSSVPPRYWACSWADWTEMEAEHGYEPPKDFKKVYTAEDLPKVTGRRKAGTASFSLKDGERPGYLTEIFKFPRSHHRGLALDIAPLLKGVIR